MNTTASNHTDAQPDTTQHSDVGYPGPVGLGQREDGEAEDQHGDEAREEQPARAGAQSSPGATQHILHARNREHRQRQAADAGGLQHCKKEPTDETENETHQAFDGGLPVLVLTAMSHGEQGGG